MMARFLFPDQNPPPFPKGATADDACMWLLAVMDTADPKRRFVASLLNHALDRGYLTEKQIAALRSVASKTINRYMDQDLECQGSGPAKSQVIEFGNVVMLKRATDGEVLE